MTDNNHPITPPDELVYQWIKEASNRYYTITESCEYIATQAARWGADMELVACCEWLETGPYGFSIEATAPSMTKRLRAARRPKSQAEKALASLDGVPLPKEAWQAVSAALERLRELEESNE